MMRSLWAGEWWKGTADGHDAQVVGWAGVERVQLIMRSVWLVTGGKARKVQLVRTMHSVEG